MSKKIAMSNVKEMIRAEKQSKLKFNKKVGIDGTGFAYGARYNFISEINDHLKRTNMHPFHIKDILDNDGMDKFCSICYVGSQSNYKNISNKPVSTKVTYETALRWLKEAYLIKFKEAI